MSVMRVESCTIELISQGRHTFNLKLFQRSMAKKQDSPCKNENSSVAAKFGNTLSFLSVLICSAVLVRVEIVNQRVDTVENSLVEIRLQNPDTNFHGFGESFRQEKRERYISRLNLNDQEVRDLEHGKNVRLRTRRFSGSTPDNQDLIVEAVRKEINKTLSSLKPEAFCSSKEQICVQGPPGIPGSKGSRGKRGQRGNTGRKGSRGFTGDPGPHGKQGIQGPPGQKGAQGEKGVPGPRGYPGAKGDAGESISAPTAVISPMTQTLRENQTAIFRCSATGNPKPSVTWFRSDRNWTGHFRYQSDGRLEVRGVSLIEAGVYTCVAKNVLGAMNKSAILTVEVPPRVQLAPGPTHVKTGGRVTLPRCKVTGYPVPVVTWEKFGGVLATERAVYGEGSLTVVGAIKADTGSYQCRAKNNLGESSAVTTLVVWTQPKFILRPPSRAYKRSGQNLLLNCKVSAQASISWRRVGGDWIEDRMKVKNGTLEISSLRKSDSGTYICEAKLFFYTIRATTSLQVVCTPLGVSDRNAIKDVRMTATTVYPSNANSCYPGNGRLNGIKGWCPRTSSDRTDYLQVDMGSVHSLCAVATQGYKGGNWRTTSYKLHLSTDGVIWNSYKENNVEKVFQGNTNNQDVVQHSLTAAVKARFVRFYPLTANHHPSLRVEIYVTK
ncbi:roundabout homolog 1-like [Acropora millepora]|uniref:roundabout homolog 1-like n=1 Tax=Acropora millepora TaxID=45264 RepID=UPI001CF1B417|nr:roundabout homolog 1-like [Acropora millepora]